MLPVAQQQVVGKYSASPLNGECVQLGLMAQAPGLCVGATARAVFELSLSAPNGHASDVNVSVSVVQVEGRQAVFSALPDECALSTSSDSVVVCSFAALPAGGVQVLRIEMAGLPGEQVQLQASGASQEVTSVHFFVNRCAAMQLVLDSSGVTVVSCG